MKNARMMRRFSSLTLLCLGACTSGQVGQLTVTSVNIAASSKLQFGIGWATTYPAASSNLPEYSETGYGINLVETFRQSNGRSAVLTDSVEVDVPSTLGTQLVAQSPQTAPPVPNSIVIAPPAEAYGAGINNGSVLETGVFNPTNGLGGPPAFTTPVDETTTNKEFWEGYDALFPIVPVNDPNAVGLPLASALQTFPGQYGLNVTVPTGGSNSEVISQKAMLAGNPLPAIAPPSVAADGTGGATVTIVVPAGVTETMVTIVGDACQQPAGAASATVLAETYTLLSHRAGPGTDLLTLPDFVTPVGGLGTYTSLCSQAQNPANTNGYRAYAVGFDYPAFESVYPQSFSQTPAIVGNNGQSDITISIPTSFMTP